MKHSQTPAATTVGRHLLADLHGVAPALLTDATLLEGLLATSLREAGFHVLRQVTHKFPGAGSGVTSIALLSESHATLHTYPEYGYLAMDVFSCGEPSPEQVLESVVRRLQPGRVDQQLMPRGG